MKLTSTQIVILGGLSLIACAIFGATAGIAAFLLMPGTTIASVPTSISTENTTKIRVPSPVPEPTNSPIPTATKINDTKTAQRILQAFFSLSEKEPRNSFVVWVAGEESADWVVETRDPKREVWLIGVREETMDASGKSTVIVEVAYYDLTTKRLRYAPLGIEAIRTAGYYPPDDIYLSLD